MNHVHLRALVFLALTAVVGYVVHGVGQAQERGQPNATADAPTGAAAEGAGMQCPMMAALRGIELQADSPAVLRARAEELGLDEQQLDQLKEIQRNARQQARGVLTDEQRQQLEDDPEGPLSMMQLSRLRMRGMMRDGMPEGTCPMCMRMMRRQHGEEGSPRR